MYTYSATLVRVIDGGTARLDLDLGFGLRRRSESYRFAGIDAPEMNTPEGVAAKDALDSRLRSAASLLAQTSKADKYGRWLVELYADGSCINDWLVSNGLAIYRTY
jgi:Micrococcal nuclease (thermonuclease) homologs